MTLKERRSRPWADDEVEYVRATMDAPRQEVADRLDRSVWSVATMRRRLREGWVRQRHPYDPAATEARFNENIDRSGDCWIWTGTVNNRGYGAFYANGGGSAHRWSYEHFVGPIPKGMQIDHLCRVRRCVNPGHLEPVTPSENVLRSPITIASKWAARTHCGRGHEFTPENTYMVKGRKPTHAPSRACKQCRADRQRRRRTERGAA